MKKRGMAGLVLAIFIITGISGNQSGASSGGKRLL